MISISEYGVSGTPISGEYIRNTGSLNRQIAENPRSVGPMNCGRCGRFVWGADCGLVWDDYCGGWEADPLCQRCRRR